MRRPRLNFPFSPKIFSGIDAFSLLPDEMATLVMVLLERRDLFSLAETCWRLRTLAQLVLHRELTRRHPTLNRHHREWLERLSQHPSAGTLGVPLAESLWKIGAF
jgi:hypothetical protein